MVNAQHSALIQGVRTRLELIHQHLGLVQSGLIVASLALRHQHCEQDVDIARMLDYGVGDRLSVQLDCVAEVVEALRHPAEGDITETPEEEQPSIQ